MPKTPTRVKAAHAGSSRKKASPKAPRSAVKAKRSKRPALHGHHPKVSEALHRSEHEPKATAKAKRPLPGSSRKKASPRTARPASRSKQPKGPILYGHYHRLHETLKRYESEPEEEPESEPKPTASTSYWGSWNF